MIFRHTLRMADYISQRHFASHEYSRALQSFAGSSESFSLLRIVPADKHPAAVPPKTLYVLDSSFNPPTLAHLRIAASALTEDTGTPPKRLLLLLATQNADKPSKPASFEDRLVMMTLFAQDLRSHLQASQNISVDHEVPPVDIGVTKKPYFHDKAAAITASYTYPGTTEQVHLTGFDTLIRIFNPKYYPPDHTLASLEPFLSQHRLRVTYRTDDEWGGREEQESYLHKIASGEREKEGGKREWAERIELVEGKKDGEEVVSSTKARKATKNDPTGLKALVTPSVMEFITSEGLYTTDD